jgi:hypothetical protein
MATKHTYKVGDKVLFTGYAQLDQGEEERLTVGTEYKVQTVTPEGAYVLVDRDGRGDTVFDDEIEPAGAKKTTRKASAKTTAKPAKATTAKATTTKKGTKAEATRKAKSAKATEKVVEAVASIEAAVAALTDSKSVAAILESKDMLTAAKELAVAAEETFISLGGVLSHIYDSGAHKVLGFDGKRGFADYMLKELNILYRKGMYLIDIYKVTRRFNLDERLVAEIGWSKMKEIANRIDAENANELLEYARDHTREDLVAHVRKTYVKAGESADDPGRVLKTKLAFSLFGDQAQVVERALQAATAQIENATPEQALMLICSEWSQFTESVELSATEALKALVARFGQDTVSNEMSKLTTVEETAPVVELETA